METKFKLAGHAIHPMLIVFPLGLLSMAGIFDLITLATGRGNFSLAAYYMIGAGILTGLFSAVFGFVDWLQIPSATRAKRVGIYHALGNVGVLALFTASFFLRRDNLPLPPILALVFSYAGIGGALITGWLGGELVERLGVGVDNGAHLNAPNSLTHVVRSRV